MSRLAQVGAALRYRWKLVSVTFLLTTAFACWWQTMHPLWTVQASSVAGTTAPTFSTPRTFVPHPAPANHIRHVPHTITSGRPYESSSKISAQMLSEITRLRSALEEATTQQNAIDAELATLPAPVVRMAPISPRFVAESKELAALRAQVATDRANLTKLQTRYTDQHPDVVKAREDLATAEDRVMAFPKPVEPAPTPLPATSAELAVQQRRVDLTIQRNQVKYQISALQSDLEDAQSALARVPKAPAHKSQSISDLAQMDVSAPVLTEPVDLAPAPTPQPAPNVPVIVRETDLSAGQFLRTLPLSALFGFVLSIGMLVCVEALDNTVKGPVSLHKLLPEHTLYLGTVSRMRG